MVEYFLQLAPNVPDVMEVNFALVYYTLYGTATLVALTRIIAQPPRFPFLYNIRYGQVGIRPILVRLLAGRLMWMFKLNSNKKTFIAIVYHRSSLT